LKDFGISIVEQLIEKGLIKNIADIYKLTVEDVASLKKNGKKFASNLIEAIENSKKNDLSKVINGLGIRHTGNKTSKTLAKHYKTIDSILNASLEELSLMEDVGPIIAKSIYQFFKQEKTLDLIQKLKEAGVNMAYIEEAGADERFFGKTFVLTRNT